MKYAKLINNFPQYAPNPILHDGNYIGNPPCAVHSLGRDDMTLQNKEMTR